MSCPTCKSDLENPVDAYRQRTEPVAFENLPSAWRAAIGKYYPAVVNRNRHYHLPKNIWESFFDSGVKKGEAENGNYQI